jgi:hypothetical protein
MPLSSSSPLFSWILLEASACWGPRRPAGWRTWGVGATVAGLLDAMGGGRRRAPPARERKNGEGPREGEAWVEAGGSRRPWVLAHPAWGASHSRPERGHGRGPCWPPRLGERPGLRTMQGKSRRKQRSVRGDKRPCAFVFSLAKPGGCWREQTERAEG